MIYEKMPFGKYMGVFLFNIPSNYLIHSLESFELPIELKDCIKDEIFKRLNIDSSSKITDVYHLLRQKYLPSATRSCAAVNAIEEFYSLIQSV